MIRAIERLDLARWRPEAGREALRRRRDADPRRTATAGTRHGIGVDVDGLLRAGEAGLALTWMDAIVNGEPVTPRRGQADRAERALPRGPALRRGARAIAAATTSAPRSTARAGSASGPPCASGSSTRRPGWIRDVVDPDGPGDPDAFRPNMLFALAAEPSPFPAADAERNLAKVELDLLTPFGLRTLAPDHPAYVGAYRGDQASRDRAYHQGTVWPWLLGVYADALVRVRGDGAADARLRSRPRSRRCSGTSSITGRCPRCSTAISRTPPVGARRRPGAWQRCCGC